MSRKNINRVLTAAGGLTLISGLFMLFHYESYFTQSLHEIAALVTAFFMLLHVKANWAALKSVFKTRWLSLTLLGFCLFCIVMMLVLGRFDYKELEVREHLKDRFGIELPHGRLR